MRYEFREAVSDADRDGIRLLNHRIFAEEVGQHEAQPDGRLRDPFEAKSRFWIALHEGQVVGMVAVHDQPPFSIAKRLADPAALDNLAGLKLEVRLLAVEAALRNRMVMAGVLWRMIVAAIEERYDVLLISGITERAGMYHRLGFMDLGPAVREGAASFIPMMIRLTELPPELARDIARWRRRA